jgi:hypothetical protein
LFFSLNNIFSAKIKLIGRNINENRLKIAAIFGLV